MKLKVKEYIKNWQPADYLLVALIIVFPCYNKLMPSLLVLMAITLLWNRRSWIEMRSILFDFKGPSFWSLVLFIAHIFGVAYSSNSNAAWEDVGMKFSLFAIPFVLSLAKLNISLRKLLDSFLVGLVITVLLMFFIAVYRTLYLPHTYPYKFFIASDFTFTMHRSYFAMYSSLGLLLSIYRLFVDRKWINIVWASLLLLATVLAMSKAGLLILLLILPFLLVYLALKIFNVRVLIISLLTLFAVAALTLWQSDTIRGRFGAMFAASKVEAVNNNSTEGNNVRVIMWSTSMKLINENFLLGVGTGDVNDALNQRNHDLGNHAVAKRNFNSHNQYLNTFVALGLLGFCSLCLIFLSAIVSALRKGNILLLLFAAVFCLSLLFESMFETQAGLMPIILLLIVLNTIPSKEQG